MPKVLSYTPEWLSRPSPGYHLFAPKQSNGNGAAAKKKDFGPRKTIATRGSEIFVAVGHEIRWADLVNLKEGVSPAYRTLRVSIPLPITRLTISPAGDYLAVSTSHTVHVVALPDPSLLESGNEDSPIKPKTFQVGPTAHVLEESPIATTLWHPLGYHGRCLVTITKSGVVRLWEVNRADRSTFSDPTLSIDLVKLINAQKDQDDLGASIYGASKGFSPDSVELEVASASFGDFPEQEGVHGWAPMTLWIATVIGNVYALCPVLPSRWQLVETPDAFTFLQTLISSININYTELSEDDDAPKEDVKTSEKQLSWLSDILYEEPFLEALPNGDSIKVFNRPASTPAVPLLQGPFAITPQVEDFELSDMIVYSLKTFSDGTEEEAAEGLPAAVVCLLTDTCKVHVCIDLEGIVGRWLPSAEDDFEVTQTEHDLIIAETITLKGSGDSTYNQTITQDVHTDFSFFVSTASGVTYISMEPWIRKLENELSEPHAEGADFRLQRLLASASSQVTQYLDRRSTAEQEVTSAAIVEDGNVGYMLLTTVNDEPQAAILDAPEDGIPTEEELAEYLEANVPQKEVREAWREPKEFYEQFNLLNSINIPARHKASLKDEVRLSPANLELLMDVHRVLSAHTERLQKAVADLFNRATRLQDEFRDQIYRTAEVIPKIDAVIGNDEEPSDNGSMYGSAQIDDRLEQVRKRQDEINARYESLRRKMNSIGSTELSEKEANYVEELQAMDSSVDKSNRTLTDDVDGSEVPAWQRLSKLKELHKTLAKQVEDTRQEAQEEQARAASVKVPSHSRRQENEYIQELLQRNTALVDAATTRLRSLGVSIPAEGGN
ncbi:nuclear pore complex protein an-nup82 [Stagonosporopsis vannaccii]|nr:nuclear pore complex protein an-nup82 [Stagonosporopsis vannaccii]